MVKEEAYKDPLNSELTSKLILFSLLGYHRKKEFVKYLSPTYKPSTISDALTSLCNRRFEKTNNTEKKNYLIGIPQGEGGKIYMYTPNYKELKKEIILLQLRYVDVAFLFGKEHFPKCNTLLKEALDRSKKIEQRKQYYTNNYRAKQKLIKDTSDWVINWKEKYNNAYNEEIYPFFIEKNLSTTKEKEEIYKIIIKNTPSEISELIDKFLNSFRNIEKKNKQNLIEDVIPRINNYVILGSLFFLYLSQRKEEILNKNNRLVDYFTAMHLSKTNTQATQLMVLAYPMVQDQLSHEDILNKMKEILDYSILGQKYPELKTTINGDYLHNHTAKKKFERLTKNKMKNKN